MTTQYTCDLCKKVFTQKIDFTRHTNRKAPCITLEKMHEITKKIEQTSDVKGRLIQTLKSCLNVLRDNEGLTGDKALRNLSYLLILKLVEPRIGNEIDIDGHTYDFDRFDDVEANKKRVLSLVRFSVLACEKDDDIPVLLGYVWDIVLSVHPKTKNIFLPGKGFDIKHKTTFKKIIDKLNMINLLNTDHDVLGNSYEEVIQDIMTGKVLGQYFTQPLVKKMMVKLINPQIFADGKIETCCDPTMGTAGFLISCLQHVLQQAKLRGIEPDWEFIKTTGIYGKELEPDTYQLAVSNMLISSGHMFEQLDRGDSIRDPITRKFDNILANPPYGISGLNYDDFQSTLKAEYIPIKTDNAVSLFIQAIIYMLKIGGKCAVVLPDGQDLFSKTNATLVAIREYLMKTCDLKEIIYLPSGIFTYTSIKTCVFYFVKKREGTDVLETKIKISKTQKETGRDYKFSKTHQTNKVKFYDYNPYEDVKNLLVEVPIDKISENSYSLNYAEYMKDETEKDQYEKDVVVKTIGEVCKFLPKSKRQASYGETSGEYPFYTSSQTCSKYCGTYDYEDECLIIGTGGNANIKYSRKFSCSTDNLIIKINEGQLVKYIYYYLSINIELLQKGFVGVGLQHISKEYISNIKIPIPSLDKQQEIVKYLDFIYETANKTSSSKIAELKQLNEFCLNNQKIFGENVVKSLGEVCKFQNGYSFKSSDYEKQNETNIGILQIKSIQNGCVDVNKITEYIQENTKYKTFEIQKGDILIALSGATTGKIGFYDLDHKLYLNQRVGKINVKTNIIQKYVYYWYVCCGIDEKVLNLAQGTAQPNISTNDISNMKIPIPSLDKQKEIVDYCEYNITLIKQLEKEIENNKKQAQQFITGIVKAHFTTESEEQNIANEIVELHVGEDV